MADHHGKVEHERDEDRAEAGAARKQREKDPSEHNAAGQGLSG